MHVTVLSSWCQFNRKEQLTGGIDTGWNCPRAIGIGGNCPGDDCPGAICMGIIFRGELSRGLLVGR